MIPYQNNGASSAQKACLMRKLHGPVFPTLNHHCHYRSKTISHYIWIYKDFDFFSSKCQIITIDIIGYYHDNHKCTASPLQWRHNERDGVSNHPRIDVRSTVCSGADQRKYQNSAPLAFVRGIHWWPVDSPHKGPVTWKMFPFDDVIMHYIVISKTSCAVKHIDMKYTYHR